tara:strand:+ start:307 stop:1074 length:768 start_codon:yes stop_codon:yes gene_type:complete
VQNIDEAQANPPSPVQYIVGDGNSGILPYESRCVLFAPIKEGKSTLLQYIGQSVAGGLQLFGRAEYPTEKHTVMYVQAEMSQSTLHERIIQSALSGVTEVKLRFQHGTAFGLYLDTKEAQNLLESEIQRTKPSLLLLDPLYKLSAGDIITSEGFDPISKYLDYLINSYHLSVIFSIQARKSIVVKSGKIDMGSQEMLGTVNIGAWVDSVIAVKNAGETKRHLFFTLRHGRESHFSLVVDFDPTLKTYSLLERRRV